MHETWYMFTLRLVVRHSFQPDPLNIYGFTGHFSNLSCLIVGETVRSNHTNFLFI